MDELDQPPDGQAVAPPEPAAAPIPLSRPAPATPRPLSLAGLGLDLLLLALIVTGIYFRFSWTNWSQDTDLHPDEYGLTGTLTQLRIPTNLGDYFNTRISPLSPYQKYDIDGNPIEPSAEFPRPDNRMRWGQWPLIIIRYTAEVTDNTGYRELRLMGRRLSALADSLALGVIFLIGLALYGRRVGLMAAALSALAVMQLQQSHFMTADTFAVLFTMLTIYSAVRVARGGDWTWYGLFGVFFGMALASRINLAPLAAEIGVAAVIAYADRWRKGGENPTSLIANAGLRLALAGVAALITFRVTQPMTFRAPKGDTTILTLTPNQEWVASMEVASSESSGQGGGPPGEQWTNRPALVFPFVNMVLWGMGLPLGLLAWAGLLWATWRSFKSSDDVSWRRHLVPLTWAGGYFLFMGTRWVKSIRYFLPIYPIMALFAAWGIVALWQWGGREKESEGDKGHKGTLGAFRRYARPLAVVLGGIVLFGTLAWAWGFTSIYRHDNTRVQASRWMYQTIPAAINLQITTASGVYVEPLPVPQGLPLGSEAPYRLQFTSHVTGALTSVAFGFARNGVTPADGGSLQVVIGAKPDGAEPLGRADIVIPPAGSDPRGMPASASLGPVALENDKTYYLELTVPAGQIVELQGATVSSEDWDEGLPLRLDGRDAFGGLYTGLTMNVRWNDNEDKRQMFYSVLSQTDYIFLPSQRGLWSVSRLPNTYPMTNEYYRALFDGSLGFDLVQQFQSPIIIGPLQISDVAGTWAWGKPPPNPPPRDFPFNNNILAAEEAFSVYDHAPVWIFKKRADFDLARAQQILGAIDLTQVVNQGPLAATSTPTLLKLPPDRLAEQRAGGTWSEMFDADGLLNRYEWLGVIVWYLAILVLGWLSLPLAFVVFGGFRDRGYALTRTLSLLVATWLVWMAGSYRLLPFTRGTIVLGYLVLAVVSGLIYWRRRAEINAWLRANRRYVLAVEALALGLFVFDLFIRWGNPDLWHPYKGGEKPMVFSFLNAVLKSTSFPPYNPWLAGYYLNYYYYGFIVVSLPIKLLGIVPAFAYNLVLPTLFSLTGLNAFAVAFNLVAAARGPTGKKPESAVPLVPVGDPPLVIEGVGGGETTEAQTEELEGDPYTWDGEGYSRDDAAPAPPAARPLPIRLPAERPNAYIAGIAAALLVVVLGNLAQVLVFVTAFQNAADHAALATSALGDNDFTASINGFWRIATGATTLPLDSGQLYWTASRVLTDLYHADHGEITEFPFFTFLYADLHAHMIDMPLTLLALAWAAAYVLLRSRRGEAQPSWLEWGAMWAVGGLALGVARATNTWDFPLFLALGMVAVAAGEWMHSPGLSRGQLFQIGWRAVLVIVLAYAFYHPFDQWFAAAYSQVKRYTDMHAPIGAYLYIHGLFLFILVSFLALETRRWLAETPATVLTEAGDWLPAVVLVIVLAAVALAVFWVLDVPAGYIAVPVMIWAGLLLLRSPDTMSMSKRVVLFLLGTALAVTMFVELFSLEGDRMNTVFKFYIQVWVLLSVAGGAALAWLLAAAPEWRPGWRMLWTSALAVLVAAAALYPVTATAAKIKDRFSVYVANTGGCEGLSGMPLPYAQGLPPDQQPHSLEGMRFMTWSGYCDHDAFLPLAYDHDGIRWLQDNVQGSPVIAEAQSFDLYRMSSRYTWFTGLPDVVGWDYHTRQHNAAIPTQFVTERGNEIIVFYSEPNIEGALAFIQRYDVRYVIVGPMERAYYAASGGLSKFDQMVAQGSLSVVHQNPGTIIYAVNPSPAGQ